ncbi:TetR family transcriptional regulator [Paenibacillus beijingensis]|uniref:TetR family transcriptional regulator n=2 Tax=Paenibacillus beijingensis TaxID=1126833 RepID=A0A0D5NQ75_9BACL|nr:TetR family transcriptional regulator [Paenibacillus beijingensis]
MDATPSRKEQIIDAAVTLFASQGYYKTTTAHVAGAVGVTQPYVFHFFKSKEQLFIAVLERAVSRLQEAFRAVDAPKELILDTMGQQFNRLIESHRDEMLVTMQSFTTSEPAIRDAVRTQFSHIYEIVKDRLERAGVNNSAANASMFIGSGMMVTLSEVLDLPELLPKSKKPL